MNPVQRHKIAVFAAKAADRFRAAILDYRHHYSNQS